MWPLTPETRGNREIGYSLDSHSPSGKGPNVGVHQVQHHCPALLPPRVFASANTELPSINWGDRAPGMNHSLLGVDKGPKIVCTQG